MLICRIRYKPCGLKKMSREQQGQKARPGTNAGYQCRWLWPLWRMRAKSKTWYHRPLSTTFAYHRNSFSCGRHWETGIPLPYPGPRSATLLTCKPLLLQCWSGDDHHCPDQNNCKSDKPNAFFFHRPVAKVAHSTHVQAGPAPIADIFGLSPYGGNLVHCLPSELYGSSSGL